MKFRSCEITICQHYNDIIMSAIASQITSPTIVYSAVDSDTDERKHESSASLAFVGEFTGAHMRGTYYICTIWFILITQQTNSMILFRLFCCSDCDIQIVIYWPGFWTPFHDNNWLDTTWFSRADNLRIAISIAIQKLYCVWIFLVECFILYRNNFSQWTAVTVQSTTSACRVASVGSHVAHTA